MTGMSEKRKRKREAPLILICGCYANKGFWILEELAQFLRGMGINAYTSSQLYPLPQSASPEEKRKASFKSLERASGVLFVALSHSTLGVPLGTDIVGGWATETGMIYVWREMGEKVYRATLYDGVDIIKHMSSMVVGTGWGYEAVAEEGNLEQIRALAFHLCRRLLEDMDKPGLIEQG